MADWGVHGARSPVSTLSAVSPIVNTLRRLGRRLDLTVIVAVFFVGTRRWAAAWIETLAARSTLDLGGVAGTLVVSDGLVDVAENVFKAGPKFD